MENKSIELVTSQVERIEKSKKGETVLLMFPIDESIQKVMPNKISAVEELVFINKISPIVKGDKDIFVKEDFYKFSIINPVDYKADMKGTCRPWTDASQMTKEQSRYTISECIDVRVVRVQDIPIMDMILVNKGFDFERFSDRYEHQLKEANINRTYHDNDYVFLIEVKR